LELANAALWAGKREGILKENIELKTVCFN
jgi:hypothetical protein